MYEIYKKGKEQLIKEMNLIKVIKNIRNQVIFNSLNGYTEQIKFKVKSMSKNLILIEDES